MKYLFLFLITLLVGCNSPNTSQAIESAPKDERVKWVEQHHFHVIRTEVDGPHLVVFAHGLSTDGSLILDRKIYTFSFEFQILKSVTSTQ